MRKKKKELKDHYCKQNFASQTSKEFCVYVIYLHAIVSMENASMI